MHCFFFNFSIRVVNNPNDSISALFCKKYALVPVCTISHHRYKEVTAVRVWIDVSLQIYLCE